MKKILMIGAGIGQMHLAEIAKARGLYLIVVTLKGDYPVISIADKVYYEDIFNKDAVLSIAMHENIDCVISDQNDLMMPTVAYIAEHMGLPGNSCSQVMSYCNKNIFRDNCDKLSIPVPKHCAVSDISIPYIYGKCNFPWIVKPADSQSSIGVTKVNNYEEYLTAVDIALNKSKSHTAIVEEFFVGKEIVVEGFIYKGVYYNLGFADREYFQLKNIFIPSQTLFPSKISRTILNKICDSDLKKDLIEALLVCVASNG